MGKVLTLDADNVGSQCAVALPSSRPALPKPKICHALSVVIGVMLLTRCGHHLRRVGQARLGRLVDGGFNILMTEEQLILAKHR